MYFLGSTESINALGMSDDAFERFRYFVLHNFHNLVIYLDLHTLVMMD